MKVHSIFAVVAVTVWSVAASGQARGIDNCSKGHCSKVSGAMNEFCIANGMANKPYLVLGPNGEECYCHCSCVTADTLVTYADDVERPISDSAVGDVLQSPLEDDGSGRIDTRLMSDPDEAAVLRLSFSNGTTIVASPNHPFVIADEIVTVAKALRPGDAVLDGELHPVHVVGIEEIDDFKGELHNLIVNGRSGAAIDHLIVTNGILSGDWLLQANNDQVEQSIALRTGTLMLFDGSQQP